MQQCSESFKNNLRLTFIFSIFKWKFFIITPDNFINSAEESVHSKIASSFNDVGDSPSLLQVRPSEATSSKATGEL